MGKRRSSRKTALQFLYQADSASGGSSSRSSNLRSNFESFCLLHHEAADGETLEFAFLLCQGVLENINAIDGILNRSSEHWRVSRMSMIDRNILRLSVYEIVFLSDIPLPVTINEAIEVAKEFGSETSAAFINGILDKIGKSMERGEFGDDN
ncbi:MAG: transcription antitermination factor NusB [Candidatus Dadabacteria bacterium]|nr:transcription antitermination factor NusB [Candidatus Dadabacteria bacterium]MDE0158990.1 transcription antitermination factor NusB [Candidatus Dadabacteria bacterium]MDE0291793.1 transcription antitermination factor NusB [Candidatus Dadabacteria bacterium]MDE0477652.1 transcription antitermination factor NusB [Candidatus Dadabacteria bacterium]